MTKITETPNADRVLNHISELELSFIRPLGAFNTAMVDASMNLLEEWTSFVAKRVRQDVRTAHQMLHCRNAAQMQAIQSGFFQQAINEYQGEAARMQTILQKAHPEPTQPNGKIPGQS